MTIFGLVHGAWHGSWCWDLVVAELGRRGHHAVAVDLPVEDPAAGVSDYADLVIEALKDYDDVTLVAHSLGGLTMPVVAQRRPVRRMVFVAALIPVPRRSFDELRPDEPDRLMPGLGSGQVTHADGSTEWQPQAAIATMYPDAPPSVAEWAAAQLRRQQWRITREVTPLTAWPRAEVSVVACASDAVVNPDWVRRYAKVRLGTEALLLPGDHTPMLARPAELVDLLTGPDRRP